MIDTRFYRSNGSFTLSELIQGLQVELPDQKFDEEIISSCANLADSKPSQISFLENKRHKDQALTASATACFVPEKLAQIVGNRHIIPIVSKSPKAHFARCIKKMVSPILLGEGGENPIIAKTAEIHPTSIIGKGAIIEDGVIVSPYVIIGPGVHIKARSYIGAHTHIECAVIGEDCYIKANAVIGGAGFGIASDEIGLIDIPHIGRVIIGDRVSIGSQTCVDRGQLGDTILEDDVKIDNLVQIAHNVVVGARTVMAGHVGVSGSCIIGSGVQLGGNVGLADHINVGDGASVAARAGVMHDIPAGEVWSGIPAMPIREHMRLISATRKLIKKPKA